MIRILGRAAVLGAAFIGVALVALWGVGMFGTPERGRPALVAPPPLQPSSRISVVVAPASIPHAAVRDMLEQVAPRDLSGSGQDAVSDLLRKAQIGWSVTRGPMAVAGRDGALVITTPLDGTLRVTGQLAAQAGNLTGTLGGLIDGNLGRQMQALTGRALDQAAGVRGQAVLQARPAMLPNWRLDPQLTGRVSMSGGALNMAGLRLNLANEATPLVDRAVGDQVARLQARIRNDPFLERAARREWAKLCRSFPLAGAVQGMPDLWLEMRPTRAFAGDPRIDTQAITLTVGIEAETRVVPRETKPACPFPAAIEITPPIQHGRFAIALPIDIPFSEVNRVLNRQLKDRSFPEGGGADATVTVRSAAVAASGKHLLISLRVRAQERRSWFGLGADAHVHVWGRPVLDRQRQILRLDDVELALETEGAASVLSAAARAAVPYLRQAVAENAVVDLKPFAAGARKSVAAALAPYLKAGQGVQVDANVAGLRLDGIEFDADTLRVIAEADGSIQITVSSLGGL